MGFASFRTWQGWCCGVEDGSPFNTKLLCIKPGQLLSSMEHCCEEGHVVFWAPRPLPLSHHNSHNDVVESSPGQPHHVLSVSCDRRRSRVSASNSLFGWATANNREQQCHLDRRHQPLRLAFQTHLAWVSGCSAHWSPTHWCQFPHSIQTTRPTKPLTHQPEVPSQKGSCLAGGVQRRCTCDYDTSLGFLVAGKFFYQKGRKEKDLTITPLFSGTVSLLFCSS